ncbi:MAG: DUF4870 domain-containing protein [Terrimicrobiaceae bacterium]|nr:DUF4870 domain-containing protein [Terrimicrobiaceae bacterium]
MDEPNMPVVPPAAPDPETRQWILATHLTALVGLVVPLGNLIGPLIVWLLKKQQFPAVDTVGRQVLNFQISWSIWMVVSIIIAFVGSCLVIPIILPVVAWIAWLVLLIIGAVKASNGETYTFPLTIKFL